MFEIASENLLGILVIPQYVEYVTYHISRGALVFSLICAWINDGVNNSDAGDLSRRRVHYDVTVMEWC